MTLQFATVSLYGPGDEFLGTGDTGDTGAPVCFSFDGTPGEYVVVINRTCYLEAGGPVDLICGDNGTDTVPMTVDSDECIENYLYCGCPDETILRSVTYHLDRLFLSSTGAPNPLSDTSGTATLDVAAGAGLYRSPLLTFDPFPREGLTLRSARVEIRCDFTSGVSLDPIIGVTFYDGVDGTGNTIVAVGDVDSDGQEIQLGCRTGDFASPVVWGNAMRDLGGNEPIGWASYP